MLAGGFFWLAASVSEAAQQAVHATDERYQKAQVFPTHKALVHQLS